MGRIDNEAGYGKVNRFFTKPVVVLLTTTIIGPIIAGFVVNAVTKDRTYEAVQKATVEMLSANLEYINASDKLKDAVAKIASKDEEYKTLSAKSESAASEKEKEIEDLKGIIENMPKVEYNSISIVKNGLKTEENIDNGWATIDDRNYYSEDSVNSLLESKVLLNEETSTLFYDTTGKSDPKETKISLENTTILYDGYCYKVYNGSSSETFSLGSESYNTGFRIGSDRGNNVGYVLFDLKGDYSKISMDVGRVTGSVKKDARLAIYLDGQFEEEYKLSSDATSKHIDINLAHANDLKIELSTDTYVFDYGFANVILEH